MSTKRARSETAQEALRRILRPGRGIEPAKSNSRGFANRFRAFAKGFCRACRAQEGQIWPLLHEVTGKMLTAHI
jgi:hypothetical protein